MPFGGMIVDVGVDRQRHDDETMISQKEARYKIEKLISLC